MYKSEGPRLNFILILAVDDPYRWTNLNFDPHSQTHPNSSARSWEWVDLAIYGDHQRPKGGHSNKTCRTLLRKSPPSRMNNLNTRWNTQATSNQWDTLFNKLWSGWLHPRSYLGSRLILWQITRVFITVMSRACNGRRVMGCSSECSLSSYALDTIPHLFHKCWEVLQRWQLMDRMAWGMEFARPPGNPYFKELTRQSHNKKGTLLI